MGIFDSNDDLSGMSYALAKAYMRNPNGLNLLRHTYVEPEEFDLGYDLKLVLIPNTDSDKKFYLYKNGEKISDEFFRIGGLGGKFRDNYCSLLIVENRKLQSTQDYLKIFEAIIDTNGKVVFKADHFTSLYHLGGLIASYKNKLFNLKTGEEICENNNSSISSADSIFLKNYKTTGVMQIFKHTGEIVFYK